MFQQGLKLIKILQILLKFATNRIPAKQGEVDRYVYQCSNCSKAFRKSEYLENHIQRRHVNRSLAENGLFPLIEQIKRYNSGLFVESSSIDDLKDEIRNLQTCLKETSEDLIKEKIAREQLQRIIESEIIEKLNSLQETWSVEPTKVADLRPTSGELKDESSENGESDSNGDSVDQQSDQQHGDFREGEEQLKDSKDSKEFNLFLIKQNELIDKLGQNIDRFVERNDESKLNDKQLQNFISSAIHKEIENLLAKDGREVRELILKEAAAGSKTSKDAKDAKSKKSNKRFLLNSSSKKEPPKEDPVRRLSLHDFSIQSHLNNVNQNNLQNYHDAKPTDHTDEIVHEINQIISEDTLTKNPKQAASSFTSRIKRFPFKFRKSKSLIQLNNTSDVEANSDSKDEEATNKSESSDERKFSEKNGPESKSKDESNAKGERTKEDRPDKKSKDEDKLNDKINDKLNDKINDKAGEKVIDEKANGSNKADRPMSRFRQAFVLRKKESSDRPEDKISLSKFSSKQAIKADELDAKIEKKDEKSDDDQKDKAENGAELSNDKANGTSNKHQTNGRSTITTVAKVHSAITGLREPSDKESKILKSVLKKSNSTDSNLKLPKKQIAFSDERIEFSADEIDSSDTGSTYSLSNASSVNSAFILSPTEQVVTIQKVIERPVPAPRFNQQKTLTSL